MLKFEHQFDGEEKRDELLTIFDQERGSIVRWHLEGLQQLRKRGKYLLPESSRDEQEAWKESADPVNSFCLDCLTPGNDIVSSANRYRSVKTGD